MAKFSIIIPVFNSENFIVRALDSLYNQSFKDIEIVIVNDGSTDNSENIIKNYIKSHTNFNINYISTQNNGPSTARNIGLQNATGEYVCFLDSDDTYAELLFEKLNDACLDYDTVFFGFNEIDEDGKEISTYENKFSYLENAKSGAEVAKLKYSSKIWICNCNAVYKNKMLKDNNVTYPLGCYAGEDASFIYLALLSSKMVNSINYVGFNNYYRKTSLMHSYFSTKYLTEFNAVDFLIENLNRLKNLSDATKEYFTNLFISSKSYTCISISKRIIRDFKKFKILKNKVKEYNLKKYFNYKVAKSLHSGKRKLEIVLFKNSLFLFYLACKVYIWIGK